MGQYDIGLREITQVVLEVHCVKVIAIYGKDFHCPRK